MTETVIQVENVAKRYVLGTGDGTPARYRRLQESLTNALHGSWRRLRRAGTTATPASTEFWALQDVSFTVKRGEVVGIIGRNGAGKSTLLKVLSRITEPTKGSIRLKGRVASLLEVGTGFHPELTGRENIYLNGAILGMHRHEIKAKFDEIVAFAEVERFLDTPVKRYSSGMYVRLAFAVAAHLEPEILIVDEVLAVGDANFQKKCLNKMQDVGQGGRTVLFVSHSMPAITRLCSRAIMLSEGSVIGDGPTHEVIGVYLSGGLGTTAERRWDGPAKAPGNQTARLRAARMVDARGEVAETFDARQPVGIEIEFDVLRSGQVLVPNFVVTNDEGVCVCHPHDWQADWRDKPRETGRHRRTGWIPGGLLAEGSFTVGVALSSYNPTSAHFYERDAVAFQIVDDHDGSARGGYVGHLPGVVRPVLRWTDAPTDPAADAPPALAVPATSPSNPAPATTLLPHARPGFVR